MSETILRAENLQTHYGKIHALRWGQRHRSEGQIAVLLGSNGAGKSTTLKTISALIRSSSGRVEFMGQDITKASPHHIVSQGLIHVRKDGAFSRA
jgi:branched-chain amino acid transport system ATP-binding protein